MNCIDCMNRLKATQLVAKEINKRHQKRVQEQDLTLWFTVISIPLLIFVIAIEGCATSRKGQTPDQLPKLRGQREERPKLVSTPSEWSSAPSPLIASSSSLIEAASTGEFETVLALLDKGVDAKGRDGSIALLTAIREIGYKEFVPGPRLQGVSLELRPRFVEVIKALLKAGADPNALKFKGYFSAWIAQQKEESNGLATYSSYGGAGSKGEIVDAALGDMSALQLTQKEGLTDITDLLLKAGAR